MTDLPQYLYKFRSISGESKRFTEDIIKNNRLYFAAAKNFNDPFELNFPVKTMNKHEKDQFYKRATSNLLENHSRKYKRASKSITRSYYRKNNLQEKATEACQRYRNIPILCLSAECSNILMWSYYADSHSGICLKFKVNDKFKDTFMHIKKVNYDDNRPKIDLLKTNELDQFVKIMTTKSTIWSHENEYRIFTNFITATPQTLQFPSEILDSIIFGANCTEDQIEEVKKWCEGRTDIKFLKSRLDKDKFSLEVIEI